MSGRRRARTLRLRTRDNEPTRLRSLLLRRTRVPISAVLLSIVRLRLPRVRRRRRLLVLRGRRPRRRLVASPRLLVGHGVRSVRALVLVLVLVDPVGVCAGLGARAEVAPACVAWEDGQAPSAPAEHEGEADEEEDGDADGCRVGTGGFKSASRMIRVPRKRSTHLLRSQQSPVPGYSRSHHSTGHNTEHSQRSRAPERAVRADAEKLAGAKS